MEQRRARTFGWRAAMPLVAVLLAGPGVAAAEAACASLAVEADAQVLSQWPDLPARVRAAFAGRTDIDACARVRLALRDGRFELDVALPDGRSAARSVELPADIEPALVALLLVPEPSVAAIEPQPQPPAREPRADAPELDAEPGSNEAERGPPRTEPRRLAARGAPEPRAQSSEVRIDFSLLTAVRAGDGMVSAGLGALSTLDLASWLIACDVRLEGHSSMEASEALGSTTSLAALGGYRIRFGSTALDLAVGPALAMIVAESTSSEVSAARLGSGTLMLSEESSSSPFVPRLAVAAHYRFAMHSLLRGFAGLDAQFGPARLGDAGASAGAKQLPEWALGVVLGATLGMR